MNPMRSRALAGAVTAAVAVTALSACSKTSDASTGTSAKSIKVGIVTDESGPTVANQLPWLHGFQAKIKTVNDAGGVKGKHVDVLVEDDKFDAALGVPAYKRLVHQEKVVALSGFGASNTQTAVAPLLAEDGVTIVGGPANTTALTEPPNDHYFAVSPTYRQQAETMVGIIRKETGKPSPRVASVEQGTASGKQFSEFFKGYDGKGIDLVGDFVVPIGATSADAVAQKIIAAKPDYITMINSASGVNALLKAQQKFGSKIPVLIVGAATAPAVWDGISEPVGKLTRGLLGVTPAPTQEPGTEAMIAAAKAIGHEDEAKDSAFVTGYISAEVLVAGLEKAGDSVTKESVTKALGSLSSVDTGGLTGPLGYGTGDRIGMDVLRPYGWDYATKSLTPVGEFSDYANLPTS
jgi:branched-chain amino acid transport system substrate-binding protein